MDSFGATSLGCSYFRQRAAWEGRDAVSFSESDEGSEGEGGDEGWEGEDGEEGSEGLDGEAGSLLDGREIDGLGVVL